MSDSLRSDLSSERAKPIVNTYWRTNSAYLGCLLLVWFIAGYVLPILLIEPLNTIRLGGFQLGFWFAQQGSIYIFVALILVYVLLMNRLDKKHGPQTNKG